MDHMYPYVEYHHGRPVVHPGYYPAPYGYAAYPGYAPPAPPHNDGLLNDRFLKGLVVGAAATYLLTNETVQRTTIRSLVKVWTLMQGGVEELKERFQDAEAEIHAQPGGHE